VSPSQDRVNAGDLSPGSRGRFSTSLPLRQEGDEDGAVELQGAVKAIGRGRMPKIFLESFIPPM